MIAALTPTWALPYLAEFEPALEAVAIVAADGTTLAGDPSLPTRLAAGSERLVAAQGPRHLVIAQVSSLAPPALVRHDLEAVARDLG